MSTIFKTNQQSRQLLYLICLLLLIGLLMTFSASAMIGKTTFDDPYFFLKRQMLSLFLGLFLFTFCWKLDYSKWKNFAYPLLLISLFLLILVLKYGPNVEGAHRWLRFGAFSFQPSELAKFSIIIYFAYILSKKGKKLEKLSHLIFPHLLILAQFCYLIYIEPNFSTAVLTASVAFLMLFAANIPNRYILVFFLILVTLTLVSIRLENYRVDRFRGFLDPEADALGKGYQIQQSFLALGQGGILGCGLGCGKQQLLYLPQPHTDFIFAILGEELGFIGGAVLITLFGLFSWLGFQISFKCSDAFSALLAFGLTSLIVLQAILHFTVALGIAPPTGIPLPFISYGGSSLVLFMVIAGILGNICNCSLEKDFSTRQPNPQHLLEMLKRRLP